MTEEKQPMADGLKDELVEKIGGGALQERLKAKAAEYHGLISEDAALYLLSLETFGPRIKAATLAQARQPGGAYRLRVRLERVFPPKIFEGGGKAGRVQRAAVSDHTDSGTLVCYDDACLPLECEAVAGDMIEAEPARMRGGEFHLSQGGKITVAEKGPRAKLAGSEGIGNFEGIVEDFFGDFPYRKKGGAQDGLMSSFSISDGKSAARVVVWESPGLAKELRKGAKAVIENGVRRGGEIHVGAAGRLLFDRHGEKHDAPEIGAITIDGEAKKVEVECAGIAPLTFGFDDALAKFGIGALPDGISAETALSLKKPHFIGKKLPQSWKV